MPRPQKCKRIGSQPQYKRFTPDNNLSPEIVILSLEEFEVIKNCDYDRLDQENCARMMNTSRTTIQRIYANARIKIAEALVLGKVLEIEGGNVMISQASDEEVNQSMKNNYRLAIGVSDGLVAEHLAQCEDYMVFDIADGQVINQQLIHDDGVERFHRPHFLNGHKIDVLIIKALAKGAYNRLMAFGIKCHGTNNIDPQLALSEYLTSVEPALPIETCGKGCHGGHHG